MTQNNDNKPLTEFVAPKANNIQLGYIVLAVAANNFELKPVILNMLSQYLSYGLSHKDPNWYLTMFEKLYNIVKINRVEHETIKVRNFLFSLGDKVKSWLGSLYVSTIVTSP
jgi:hypothetical protein